MVFLPPYRRARMRLHVTTFSYKFNGEFDIWVIIMYICDSYTLWWVKFTIWQHMVPFASFCRCFVLLGSERPGAHYCRFWFMADGGQGWHLTRQIILYRRVVDVLRIPKNTRKVKKSCVLLSWKWILYILYTWHVE